MHSLRKSLICIALVGATLPAANAGIFRKKKYENPISKETLQPDKVLFDRAVNDIEHGRFEVARLTLNTLINTYDSSEFLAKAKLAIADSWYREGGAHGLAQAEAEYKDFELFYPNMEESAEAQWRVCQIHYKQMEKVDRDNSQALRADDECKQMVTAYPNSRYTGQATQMLRNVQEVLADKEFRTGNFYHMRGAFPAAANRLAYVTQQYPLYSAADEALWEEADSYKKMGDRFDEQNAAALTRIVRDYPLSDHVDEAKERLTDMKKPIPPADPAAYARMKYDLENYKKPSLLARSTDFIKRGPDTSLSAKMGAPSMAASRPPTPVSVPAAAADTSGGGNGAGGVTDVTVGVASNTSELDSKPDARAGGAPGTSAAAGAAPGEPAKTGADASVSGGAAGTAPQQPLATNHPYVETKKQRKLRMKALQKQQDQQRAEPPAPATPASTAPTTSGTPAAATGAAATSTPAPQQ